MAIYHDLDNTGQEVQQRLDQVPVTQADLAQEVLDRQAAVGAVQNNVDAEELRAKAAEKLNADDIDAIEEKIPSGASSSNKLATASEISSLDAAIDAIEEKIPSGASSSNKMATASDISSLDAAIDAILLLIPSAATSLNKLADKAFVNSSIATASATFRGTYNLVTDLSLAVTATHAQIASALSVAASESDNNDFAYVQIPVSADDPTEIAKTERYKFNGSAWAFEYELNTSGFTEAQWEAINSGVTQALISSIVENINGIKGVIPTEATDENQLADKFFVLARIVAAIPSFKGQFTTLAQLQEVTGAKAGDLGIVRTKDTDGHDVFAFYYYINDHWTYFYSLSYHPQDKPATTGLMGNYPYNGMGRVELPMNMVDAWPNDTWLYLPVNGVTYLLYSWNFQLYAAYNSGTQEGLGLGLGNNVVIKPANYNIEDIAELVGNRYLSFTEAGGIFTITKPDTTTITSTVLNNTTIYKEDDPDRHGINILTQAMLSNINTIYVVRHDYVLGEDITIPENCVLEFDGGSINGSNNYLEINLNNTPLEGTPKLISCEISNPYQKIVKFSWLGFGDDVTYNTTMLNRIAKKNINWYVDADCIVNDVITITNRINIDGPYVSKEKRHIINAPNSSGLLITANPYNNDCHIENVNISSKYNALEFTGYAYDIYIRQLSLFSTDGDGIVFAENFQVGISECWIKAPKGSGVVNVHGTTSFIRSVSIDNCKIAYHNCSTTWYDCNAVWGLITEHWLLWDYPGNNSDISITLINCNIEDIIKEAIYSTNAYSYLFNITFINSGIYVYPRDEQDAKDPNGNIRYSPISVGGIRRITNYALRNNSYPWLEGVYPITTRYNVGVGANYLIQSGSRYPALCGNIVYDTTNMEPIVSNTKPENPTVGYSMFDSIESQIITFSKIGNMNRWVTPRGYSPGKVHGTTENRPADLSIQGNLNVGYPYFDETLRMQLFLINAGGARWVDARGNTPAKRVGTTAERPTNLLFVSYFSDAGFEYFDTDLGKPIYATGKTGANINWVDATGTTV